MLQLIRNIAAIPLLLAATISIPVHADPPATSYVFPAGVQAGTTVTCRVGTINGAHECGLQFLDTTASPSVVAPARIARMETLILEGPWHQNPVAQLAWDYPKDMSATLQISSDARPCVRHWYCTTSEGTTALRPFIIGDLPEVLEDEEHTTAGKPQAVPLPVTVNGRIFPRADLDEYRFTATAGDIVSCDVVSHRLGHKLDARLQLRDSSGRLVAEADNHVGPDPLLITRIPKTSEYVLRIHDIAFEGSQDYVYRLSLRTGPCVTHIYPAGASREDAAEVRLYGTGLGDPGYRDTQISWNDATGWSMPADVNVFCPFLNGHIPEITESAADADGQPTVVSLPTVINGRIESRRDADAYRFSANKGQQLTFDVFGRRLRSPVTPVVTVHDASDKEVARHEGDGLLRFTAAEQGDYTLHVRELFHETHAGDDYVYRISARQSSPDFELRLSADRLGMEPGATATPKLQVTRLGGFDGEVRLTTDGLPEGVTLETASIPSGQNEVELSFTAAQDAPIGLPGRARITGTAAIGDTPVSHAAAWQSPDDLTLPRLSDGTSMVPAVETLTITVTHPQVFAITTTDVYGSANRGATLVQTHHLERLGDFEGPVEICLSDGQDRYLQGVTGPTMTLQPGETEFDYPAFLPESMDLNRTARMVVMGTAQVTDASGRQHYVTHRTKNQMVVRVCPSLLTLGADTEYLEGAPGSTVSVPLRVGRTAEITGDVTLEASSTDDAPLATLPTVQVTPQQQQVQYQLQLASDATPGETCQLHVRATGLRQGYPAVAETTVEIQVVDAR